MPGMLPDQMSQPSPAMQAAPSPEGAQAFVPEGMPPGGASGPAGASPIMERVKALDPREAEQILKFVTPEFQVVIAMLLGKEVADQFTPIVNKENVLRPIPKRVLDYMGREKFEKFISGGAAKAGTSGPPPQAKPAGAAPSGPPAPMAQGPQSVPTMTGSMMQSRPQLPMPSSQMAKKPTPNMA